MGDDSPALCVAEGCRKGEVDPLDGGRCVPEAQEFLDEGIDVVGAECPDLDGTEDRPDLFRAGPVRVDAVRPTAGLPLAGVDPLVHGLFDRLGRLRRLLREETLGGPFAGADVGVDVAPRLPRADVPGAPAGVPSAPVSASFREGWHEGGTKVYQTPLSMRDLGCILEELVLRHPDCGGDMAPSNGMKWGEDHRYRDRTMPGKGDPDDDCVFGLPAGSWTYQDVLYVQGMQAPSAQAVTAGPLLDPEHPDYLATGAYPPPEGCTCGTPDMRYGHEPMCALVDHGHGRCECSECSTGWADRWANYFVATEEEIPF